MCYVNWHNPLYLLYAWTFSSYSAQLHCKELRTDTCIYIYMNESVICFDDKPVLAIILLLPFMNKFMRKKMEANKEI